jgi:hypothetical protein
VRVVSNGHALLLQNSIKLQPLALDRLYWNRTIVATLSTAVATAVPSGIVAAAAPDFPRSGT